MAGGVWLAITIAANLLAVTTVAAETNTAVADTTDTTQGATEATGHQEPGGPCAGVAMEDWMAAVSVATNLYADSRATALRALRDCRVPDMLLAPMGSVLFMTSPGELIDDTISILLHSQSELATRYLLRYVRSNWADPGQVDRILDRLAQKRDPAIDAQLRNLAERGPSRELRHAAEGALRRYSRASMSRPNASSGEDHLARALRRGAAGLVGATVLTSFGSASRDRDSAAMPVGGAVGLVAGAAGNAVREAFLDTGRLPRTLVASARRLEYSLWGLGVGVWGAAAVLEERDNTREIDNRMEKTVLGAVIGNLTGYAGALLDRGSYAPKKEAFVEMGFGDGLLAGLGTGLLLDDPTPTGFWAVNAGTMLIGGTLGRLLGTRIDYQDNDLAALVTIPIWTTLLGPQTVVAFGADPHGRDYTGLSLLGLSLGSAASMLVANQREASADRVLTTDVFAAEGVLGIASFHAVVDNRLPRIAYPDRHEKAAGIVGAALLGGGLGFGLADRIELDRDGALAVSLSAMFGAANGAGWYGAVVGRDQRVGSRMAGSSGLGVVAGSALGLGVAMSLDPDVTSQGAVATTTLLATGAGLLGGLVAESDRLAPPAVIALDAGLASGVLLLGVGVEPRPMLWMPVGGIVGGGTAALIAFAAVDRSRVISGAGLAGLVTGGGVATLITARRHGRRSDAEPKDSSRWRGPGTPTVTWLDASYVDRVPLQGAQLIWKF
ncbi:MAG: hypothetical protein D6761_11760 [Candidatus Dadabacteria bacterium]|nr:MAG: hypothetical protein D6761_11760 [Candidatus Dadabacteria bacterium]